MRLFVGIPLPASLTRELAAVGSRLRRPDDGLRWTAPESWHITLQFLGNATPDRLQCLKTHLAGIRNAPFPVELGRMDCFDRAGVLIADVLPTPGLVALEQSVLAATALCGFVAESRPYHPHITLARAKGQGRGASLRGLQPRIRAHPPFTSFTAREFVLYESHLGPGGSQYEVRMRAALSAGSGQ